MSNSPLKRQRKEKPIKSLLYRSNDRPGKRNNAGSLQEARSFDLSSQKTFEILEKAIYMDSQTASPPEQILR